MDKIEIASKVIEGRKVVIWQAADYKEVTVGGHSVFISSALTPEFENEFIKLSDRKGEYCGLVVIPCITDALNNESFKGEIAGMDKAAAIYAKHTQEGVIKS